MKISNNDDIYTQVYQVVNQWKIIGQSKVPEPTIHQWCWQIARQYKETATQTGKETTSIANNPKITDMILSAGGEIQGVTSDRWSESKCNAENE